MQLICKCFVLERCISTVTHYINNQLPMNTINVLCSRIGVLELYDRCMYVAVTMLAFIFPAQYYL